MTAVEPHIDADAEGCKYWKLHGIAAGLYLRENQTGIRQGTVKAAGKLLKGVQFYFTDYNVAPTALLQFYVMQELHAMYPGRSPKIGEDLKGSMLGKVMGGSTALRLFAKRYRVEDMLEFWNKDREAYLEMARKYYRY